MTLQEEHREVVDEYYDVKSYYTRNSAKEIAKQSSEITKQYMKGFAEWVLTKEWELTTISPLKKVYSTDELIEIYLTEKQSP